VRRRYRTFLLSLPVTIVISIMHSRRYNNSNSNRSSSSNNNLEQR